MVHKTFADQLGFQGFQLGHKGDGDAWCFTDEAPLTISKIAIKFSISPIKPPVQSIKNITSYQTA